MQKIKVYLTKREGENFDYGKFGKEILRTYQNAATPGCYELTIKKAKKSKTAKQCRMIFGMVIPTVIAQSDDLGIGVERLMKYLLNGKIPKGVGLTEDFLHELMYIICPTTDENGKRVTLKDMSTTEANDLFERFRNILAPIGIVIPDPNPNWANEAM